MDGDPSEWAEEDVVLETDQGTLSMKYDEKFLYFYAQGFDPEAGPLYIPIDTTPKTGSTYCKNYGLTFERPCDFVIRIDGTDNSRIVVQKRYEVMRAMFMQETEDQDPYLDIPDRDTPEFQYIDLMLQTATPLLTGNWESSRYLFSTSRAAVVPALRAETTAAAGLWAKAAFPA